MLDSVTHTLKPISRIKIKERIKELTLNRSRHPSVHKGSVDEDRDGFLWF